MASKIATSAAKKYAGGRAEQYAAQDPYYLPQEVDERGKKMKKVKRPMPEGLAPKEQKLLLKIRRRAHYLDKGFYICGFRFGWTFFIALIPFIGDLIDALLGYNLVIKPAKKADIPDSILRRMQLNTILATGVGMIPIIGDIVMAAFKPNSRNALLFEEFIVERARQNPVGGSHSAPIEETSAQQTLDRAKNGRWSWRTGTNDALNTGAADYGSTAGTSAGVNSQGVPNPAVPARPSNAAVRA